MEFSIELDKTSSARCPRCRLYQPVIRTCWRCFKDLQFRCVSPDYCWQFTRNEAPAYESWYCFSCKNETMVDGEQGSVDIPTTLCWVDYVDLLIGKRWHQHRPINKEDSKASLGRAVASGETFRRYYPLFTMELFKFLAENSRVVCSIYKGDGSDDDHLKLCSTCKHLTHLRFIRQLIKMESAKIERDHGPGPSVTSF